MSGAEVHQVHALIAAPLQGPDQRVDRCRESPVEDLHRVQAGVRSPLPDRARDGSAMSQAIDQVGCAGERYTTGDFADVGMAGRDAAVDDRDLQRDHAMAG